jgi:O-antigen/teichoic acid export membrane protein
LKITQNSYISSALKLLSGTVSGQIILLITTPILTQLFTPDDFGVLTLFSSVIGTIWVLGTLSLDIAITLENDDKKVDSVGRAAILFSLSLGTLVLIISLLFKVDIIAKSGLEKIQPYLLLLPVGFVLICYYYILNGWLIRLNQYGSVSLAKVGQQGGMAIAQLVLGYFYPKAVMLLFGYIFGYLLGSIVQLISLVKLKVSVINFSYTNLHLRIRDHQKLIKYTTPARLANLGSSTMPPILIAYFFGLDYAGFFAISQRVVGAPINMITASISQVFLGESRKMMMESPAKVLQTCKKIVLYLIGLSFIPFCILLWKGPVIAGLVLGNDYSYVGEVAKYLTIMYFFRLISTPFSMTLNMTNNHSVQFYWDIIRLITIVSVIYLSRNQDFLFVVFSFACVQAAFYLFHYVLSIQSIKKATVNE